MKRFILLFVLIFCVAVVVRGLNLISFPIFADESIYLRWAQIMRVDPALRFLPLSDGKQPLYMWAVIPFYKFISDPLLAGRILSALAGVATVPALVVFAWILFKKPALSLLAGLVYSLVPFSVFFSRLALVDTLMVMFVMWGIVFSVLSLTKLRWDLAMLAGFAFGFAWLTKSTAMFGLALLPSLIILSKFHIKQIGLLFTTFIIAFAMYNILRLGPEFHQIALRNQDYIFPLSEVLHHPLNPLVAHLNDSFQFYFYLLTPIGLVFALLGLVIDPKTHWRPKLVLALWWLLPVFAQSFVAKAFTARYLLISLPFAVTLVAHALIHVGDRLKNHLLLFASIALVIIPCLIWDYLIIYSPEQAPLPRIERSGYLEQWTAGYGLKSVSDQIAQYAQAGPVVVGSEGFMGTPFDALSAYLNPYPSVRVVGVGVDIDSVSDKLTNALSDNQVFLVVNSSRFRGDPEKLHLQLLSSYPKAQPPVGPREYLLFFKVLK